MTVVITFITILFYILYLAILARILLTWLNLAPGNPIVQFLFDITEPILAPLRNRLPAVGMFDISPIVAMVLLDLIRRVLIAVLTAVR